MRLPSPDTIHEFLMDIFGTSFGFSGRMTQTLVIIGIILLVRYLFVLLALKQTNDPQQRYNYRRYATNVAFVVAIFLVGRVWFEGFQSLATFLGLLSAGLAIALRDLISDLAGWIFIMWRKPFELGDRIQISGHRGDVVDKRLFTFSIIEIGNWVDADQSTGRVIHLPNSKVFTDPLANYTSGFRFIWHEIPVHITFESNHKKAREILLRIVNKYALSDTRQAEREMKKASDSYLIVYNVLTPTVYLKVKENGVVLTIRFLCDVRRTRGAEQTIWLDVLDAFNREDDIRFSYKTIRVYNQKSDDSDDKDKLD